MAMKLNPLCMLVVATVALIGCEHDCYEVEIRPDGDGFERKITGWRQGGQNDAEIMSLKPVTLARIAAIYPKRETSQDAKKQTFSGRFLGETPGDVGGAGRLVRYQSPLGDCWSYTERFRGNDDLESQLAEKRKAADRLADLLVGWATAELSGEPGFADLKKFLDLNLRQDLKNLGLYFWTVNAAGTITLEEEDLNEQLWSRIGLYLCERGYFEIRDLPRLLRFDYDGLASHFQRLIARRMGVPDGSPIPDKLQFISDKTKLEASFNAFLASTDEYKMQLAKWEKEAESRPDDEKPKPSVVFEELLGKVLSDMTFGTPDSLDVKLYAARKPYSTNGDWDEKISAVAWSSNIASNEAPASHFYATWSEPNDDFQKRHFGGVVLEGKSLGEYVFWYCSLAPAEAAEWDRFIAGLLPDADWRSAVKAFRFSFDPQPDAAEPSKPAASLADRPRSLLVKDEEEE